MQKHKGLDDETLGMLLATFGDFAAKRLPLKVRLELDEKHDFPIDVIRELVGPNIGLHLLFIPEELGGLGGGAYDVYRVSEAMARVDLGVATAFLAIFLGTDPIVVGATDEQRAKWLRRIADEGLIVAYAVTEPLAGSEVSAIRTRAERIVEDGKVIGYRLNGAKQFITNGGVAELYSVLAMTEGGASFFLVEGGTKGVVPDLMTTSSASGRRTPRRFRSRTWWCRPRTSSAAWKVRDWPTPSQFSASRALWSRRLVLAPGWRQCTGRSATPASASRLALPSRTSRPTRTSSSFRTSSAWRPRVLVSPTPPGDSTPASPS